MILKTGRTKHEMADQYRRFKQEYRRLYKQLKPKNASLMQAMAEYLSESDLKEEERMEIQCKLAKKLYEAQAKGQTAEQALGRDFQGVCDMYIQLGRKKSTAEKRWEKIQGCLIGLMALVVLELFFTGTWRGLLDFSVKTPITQGFVLSTILILGFAWGLMKILNKKTTGFSGKKQAWRNVGMVAGCTVLWALIVLVKWLLKQRVLCWVNAWIPIAAVVVLWGIAAVVKRIS
ncbi:MAG: DUF1129 family protein [Christensenellales bacterium]